MMDVARFEELALSQREAITEHRQAVIDHRELGERVERLFAAKVAAERELIDYVNHCALPVRPDDHAELGD